MKSNLTIKEVLNCRGVSTLLLLLYFYTRSCHLKGLRCVRIFIRQKQRRPSRQKDASVCFFVCFCLIYIYTFIWTPAPPPPTHFLHNTSVPSALDRHVKKAFFCIQAPDGSGGWGSLLYCSCQVLQLYFILGTWLTVETQKHTQPTAFSNNIRQCVSTVLHSQSHSCCLIFLLFLYAHVTN